MAEHGRLLRAFSKRGSPEKKRVRVESPIPLTGTGGRPGGEERGRRLLEEIKRREAEKGRGTIIGQAAGQGAPGFAPEADLAGIFGGFGPVIGGAPQPGSPQLGPPGIGGAPNLPIPLMSPMMEGPVPMSQGPQAPGANPQAGYRSVVPPQFLADAQKLLKPEQLARLQQLLANLFGG